MAETGFPEMVRQLPEADVPFPGVRVWISRGEDHQVVFVDIDSAGEVPPHSHGEQWEVVIEGEVELTVDGETKRFGPGESFHIPAGSVHSAKFLSHYRSVGMFAERDRYKAKTKAP